MREKLDSQGRQFIAQHDVRGAIVSAIASLSTGTATTLIAGDADYFLDIIEMTFANNSTATAGIDLNNDGTTIRHIDVEAGATVQLSFPAPLKQGKKNLPWIVDMNDITGTTVSIGAQLIRKLD